MPSANRHISLSRDCSIRALDRPYVYNRATDELYELDSESLAFLRDCARGLTGEDSGPFVEYCLKEGILVESDGQTEGPAPLTSPIGFLRYLELQLTARCNLRCKHCYLGDAKARDLPLPLAFKTMEEFDAAGGLRLLLSGGEPLLHEDFPAINERLPEFGFRSVLLTNGTLIDRNIARLLKVQEAQVSLDGMERAHDYIRGYGNFRKAINAIGSLMDAGIAVSVATMVTSLNSGDFAGMVRLMESLGVKEWNVDVPVPSGRLIDNDCLMLDPEEAARYHEYGFGGGFHHGPEGYACGAHLLSIGPDGSVAKCGFYLDRPAGNINQGLRACAEMVRPIKLEEIDCDCEQKEACRGGCRYRATFYSNSLGPDPVRCAANGVKYSWRGGVCNDNNKGS